MMFASKRKTLLNNIRRGASAPGLPGAERYLEALEEAGIESSARAETLTVEDFRRIIAFVSEPRPQNPEHRTSGAADEPSGDA
jgi:16S rRNA A1518/A1519 N6-dimethyltransferase RsmA/KsgA/DIM1 with predicted DNA glycosylase/AP lyase activity